MNENFLKLNPEKTELLVVGSRENIWSDAFWPIEMGPTICPVPVVKSLGHWVDVDLSMRKQVSSVCDS